MQSLLGHLIGACWFTAEALRRRSTEALKACVQDETRMFVDEKIREFGDRGTSILNYLTNLVAFLAALILLMRTVGMPDAQTSGKPDIVESRKAFRKYSALGLLKGPHPKP